MLRQLRTITLMPSRKILTMGTMLRITPNSVHRHFETLLDASARAALVSDTEGIEAIRDIYINPRTLKFLPLSEPPWCQTQTSRKYACFSGGKPSIMSFGTEGPMKLAPDKIIAIENGDPRSIRILPRNPGMTEIFRKNNHRTWRAAVGLKKR